MVTGPYVPKRGDLVWLSFSPQVGREQAGRRPALVLSPAIYNERTGLAVACPVTSRSKGYPFEVPLNSKSPIAGVVLADRVRNLDWRGRNAEFAGRAGDRVVGDVAARIRSLIGA
jgi:mRNA interferase MazF